MTSRGPYALPAAHPPSSAYLLKNGKLRAAVDSWRAGGYQGATETSKRLLQFWFGEDHLTPGGTLFKHYYCQREAIETLVYCFEVVRARTFQSLMQYFGDGPAFYDPTTDRFPRYVFKMATGSGKTKVMALAMVWSYFNALREKDSGLAHNFLLLAPNVIVFERLKLDFEDGRVFRTDPIIPPEWDDEWDLQVVLRDAPANGETKGTLYLTNIQQLYERPPREIPNPVTTLLGPRPPADVIRPFDDPLERVRAHPNLLVVNDEGHHVHDEDLLWTQAIVALNDSLQEKVSSSLAAQLDFSATPKDQNGALFPWIVVDYPVAQAIEDGIVKRPIIGRVLDAKEVASKRADVRYRAWIDAGIERWKEYQARLAASSKAPILFVMGEDTTAADEIARYLNAYRNLEAEYLSSIPTGPERSRSERLDVARRASREVDSPESPYRAIVSVLMLREGWDVRNVTVVVGLRPFTAKANILPEQTVGRGLRLMSGPESGFDEKVDVIGNRAFEDFVPELEKEGVVFGEAVIGRDSLHIETILVDPKKAQYSFGIPRLTPMLKRTSRPLSAIELKSLRKGSLLLGPELPTDLIHYEGRDALTDLVVVERAWRLPIPQNAGAVVAYYSEMILRNAHMDVAGKRAELIPLVRGYIESSLFDKRVELNERRVLRRLNDADSLQVAIDVFTKAIHELTIQSQLVLSEGPPIKLSETPPFPWTRVIVRCKHTIFNWVAADNDYEARFAAFIDDARDVDAFAKLTQYSRFTIEYLGSDGGIHLYWPDFVVRLTSGEMFVVETKGREDVEVLRKDARARRWCKDASTVSNTRWRYLKLPKPSSIAPTR